MYKIGIFDRIQDRFQFKFQVRIQGCQKFHQKREVSK